MRTIKIFLASSVVEFKEERQELAAFANSINKKIVKRDIFLEMIMCEDLSNAMAKERKQDEYNEYIRDSDYVLMLFGKTVGKYTIEEFNVAWECYRKRGKPQIFTYFKEFPQGEEVEESVLDFMERLDKQLRHYYSRYTDLETVKTDLSQVIFGRALELQDGQLLLDEQQVLALENVPFYKGGRALQQKRERKLALDEEYAALIPRLSRVPSEDGLWTKKRELEQERGALQKAIGQMEADMLRERQETLQKQQLGMHMNWREKKAVELVKKEGDYEGAKNFLRDAQWEEEIRQSEKTLELFDGEEREGRLVEIRRYIFGKRLLISYLKATGLDRESVEEIKAIYEDITQKALRYQMEQKVLQEYAEFLMGQNCVQQGIDVAEKLRQHYTQDEKMLTKYKAELLLWLADLYSDHEVREYKKARHCISEVLEIIPLLYNDMEREGLTALAKAKGAIRQRLIGNVKEAEQWSREALELSAGLAEQNPQDGTLRWILGESTQNYANQMKRMGQMGEAERLGRKSVEIFEDLTGDYPSDPSWCSLFPERGDMAYGLQASYNYLANIMHAKKREKEAESLYRKALETGRSIAGRDPHGNERFMAIVCRNLARQLDKRGNQRELLEEAKDLYWESWKIYRSLFDRNPQYYRDKVAQSCYEMVDFWKRLEQWDFYDDENFASAEDADEDRYKREQEIFTFYELHTSPISCLSVGKREREIFTFYEIAMEYYPESQLDEDEWGKRKRNSEQLALIYKDAASFYWNNCEEYQSYYDDYYKAIEWQERAIDIYSQLAKDNKGKAQEDYEYQEAWLSFELAHIYYQEMRSDAARYGAEQHLKEWAEDNFPDYKKIAPLFRRALDIFERQYEKNPTIKLRRKLLVGYYECCQMLKLLQQSEEADQMHKKGLEIAKQIRQEEKHNE